MPSKYFKYVPLTRMMYGTEFAQEFVYGRCGMSNDDVTLKTVLADQKSQRHYVIMTSDSAETLTLLMTALEGRFSAIELTEEEFLGETCWLYKPVKVLPSDPDPQSFADYIGTFGLTYTQSDLELKKLGRVNMLKELTKRKFPKWNDISADITKIITLLFGHYNDLDATQKDAVDAIVNRAKAVYTADMCISAFDAMVTQLENILAAYYNNKTNIENAADDDALDAITLS